MRRHDLCARQPRAHPANVVNYRPQPIGSTAAKILIPETQSCLAYPGRLNATGSSV